MGKFKNIYQFQEYIDYFMVLIAPEHIEKIKCSSCTYLNRIIFTFTSILNDNSIEKFFLNYLKLQNINVQVESNEILDSIEKGDNNDIS